MSRTGETQNHEQKHGGCINDFSPLAADEPGLDSPLQHMTLLDELLFWTVKFEFPQKIVTFLLSLLPDDSYKVQWSCHFPP